MTKIISTNPGKNYEKIGEVSVSSDSEIRTKVENANAAKESWRMLGVKKRIEYVRRINDLCKKHASEIASIITREVGTPITACLDEVLWNKGYFEWFLGNVENAISPTVVGQDDTSLHTVYYEPIGTAAVITPWNLPFDMFVWGVIPNLLVGNTVLYKAAEECVLTGKLLEEICRDAKLPEGVLSFVHGGAKVGAALTDGDIDLIWFTGSTQVGQLLYQKASKKFIKAILEMGGSNPVLIFDDADVEGAVAGVMSKRFMFCGQTCDADKRLIVHEKIFDDVVTKLKNKIETIVVGDPEDPKTTLGPLVSKKQLDLLEGQVKDAIEKGANVVIGGKKPVGLKGAYYAPTLLTHINRSMRVWKEEVFGPVLSVVPFTTEEDAIAKANDTIYGLGSQVFTKDRGRIDRISKAIQAGNVDVNGVGHFRPFNPFGGYKKSGIGREHGIDGFRELCQIKIVSKPKTL
ncbi:MAG TPA: aldehyde dehydrogenase family protein [Patescibacteria group bacterium]|nr:aldehyde dehydrogenase family protein [Patescibacteria group bacterium]